MPSPPPPSDSRVCHSCGPGPYKSSCLRSHASGLTIPFPHLQPRPRGPAVVLPGALSLASGDRGEPAGTASESTPSCQPPVLHCGGWPQRAGPFPQPAAQRLSPHPPFAPTDRSGARCWAYATACCPTCTQPSGVPGCCCCEFVSPDLLLVAQGAAHARLAMALERHQRAAAAGACGSMASSSGSGTRAGRPTQGSSRERHGRGPCHCRWHPVAVQAWRSCTAAGNSRLAQCVIQPSIPSLPEPPTSVARQSCARCGWSSRQTKKRTRLTGTRGAGRVCT